jgi:hypothetical protein
MESVSSSVAQLVSSTTWDVYKWVNGLCLGKHILIFKESLEGATSCGARRLLVYYVVAFIDYTSATCFDLIRSSSGRNFYVISALYCVNLVRCSKIWLKQVPVIVEFCLNVPVSFSVGASCF